MMRKGEKKIQGIIYTLKNSTYAHLLRGRIQQGLKIQVRFVKRPSADRKKNVLFPRKVKIFGFGHFPRKIFPLFFVKEAVSFTKLAS